MDKNLTALKPALVWKHFARIADIPRPSHHEEKIRRYVLDCVRDMGLEHCEDEAHNIYVRKPATKGMEDRKGVILQAHLDMVPQKNNDKVFDFENDPIEAYIDGEWVTANGTTLGADNGIGAAAILAAAVAISLAGAMLTAAPLSSTGFMLELGIFRGVKMAQLLPLAFFCLLFVSYYGLFEKDRKNDHLDPRDIFTALGWTIPMWAVLLMAAVGLAGYYYLARTGHETGVTISDTEMIFRNDLEYLLLARPRTKEFLVAFPGIMLAVYCAVRRLPFWTALFGLAGTIGLTSVCNTFMHIRTPLYLGFVRTAYSLLLGILVGAVMIVCFELLLRLCRGLAGKYGRAGRI